MKDIIKALVNHPLNEGNRLKAIARFISWQIGIRVIKRPVVVNFVNDARLVVNKSMYGATGNIYFGLMEFVEMSFILHFLKDRDLLIDIGANIGTYSVISGSLGARCVAFEPIPSTFGHLKDNIAINSYQDRVLCFNVGLGDKNENILFTSNLDSVNKVVGKDNNSNIPTVEVIVRKLDDVAECSQPTVIKLDVEGYEENVLEGAKNTLKNDSLQVVIIETFGSTKFDELMYGYGFKPYTYLPFERMVIPINEAGKKKIFNTIYIKDLEEVKSRIKQSPRYKVLGKDI